MNYYFIKTNRLIKRVFSNYFWDIPTVEKKVYLTFDDGPTPEITDWVLNQLNNYQAKATFFCIGSNINKNPEILDRIINNGHTIGNHTFNHLNGWKTKNDIYIEDVNLFRLKVNNYQSAISNLFRPPYGKIKPLQANILRKLGYKIIMWDVLSADFDQNISPEKCLKNVINNLKPGSIIVFHDSEKAFHNLKYALPLTLNFLKEKGYVCDRIN